MKFLYLGDLDQYLPQLEERRTIIRKIQTVADFKQVYSEFQGYTPEVPLVLYDISLLTFRQAYMLKFVEEFRGRLVCLASEDNILPTLASRFDSIFKNIEVPEWEEGDPSVLLESLESDIRYLEDQAVRQAIFTHAPDLMPFYEQTQKAKARRKLLQVKIELQSHHA